MNPVGRVYLFDIDGTLVNAGGRGSDAFRRAVREILGHKVSWQARDFAGMTDAGLFERAMHERAGSANSQRDGKSLVELLNLYHHYLETSLAETPALVLPGVVALMKQLAAQENIRIGLLTGNSRRGSELKLANLFAEFSLGFFGDSHAERIALGQHARLQVNQTFGADVRITIVGDTPNDIACARAADAECIAVATGVHAAEELSSADRVLKDLTEWI